MNLPVNTNAFYESVKADSKQLIQLGLWDIKMARLESWLNQFSGAENKFFAACILSQLLLRTRQQFESGLRSLIRGGVNGKLSENSIDSELLDRLRSKDDPKLRLVPVISDIDPPTKSGPFVMRRLQRILQINQDWICWPWQTSKLIAESSVNSIIFIDDFLGSGNQFETFFKQWGFDKQDSNVNYYYASVVAHKDGLNYLAKNLPIVQVAVAEILDESYSFFSDTVWAKIGQGQITADDAKTWYIDFCNKFKIKPNKISHLGYNDMSLTFGFSHSTPNNSLPILWHETENWLPLLER